MTEFSVGDRVLVPGVVERVTDGQRPGVRIPGLSGALLAIDPTHLRPDTGGRDLTVNDLGAAYKAWDDQHPGWGDVVERERFIPEYLTRIVRGDAGSAGDEACTWAHPAECPVHGAGDDTAPGDDPRLDHFLAKLDRMINAEIGVLGSREVRAALDEAQATIRRLRSEATALRAAGDELVDGMDEFLATCRRWGFRPPDKAAAAAQTWRSAAGSPTTAEADR